MLRTLALCALLLCFGALPLAQAQTEDESPPAADDTAVAAEEEEDDEDFDPVIAEDVFTPSEKIEADSNISFPSDI